MTTKELQEYAWSWFEYHAGQRLVAVRYYLILLGVLALGLGNSLKDGNLVLTSAIAVAGVLISIAFLVLEFRNEDLVNVGRNALTKLEDSEEFKQAPSELKLFQADSARPLWKSHKAVFFVTYVLCILAFGYVACNPAALLPPNAGRVPALHTTLTPCVGSICTGGHPNALC